MHIFLRIIRSICKVKIFYVVILDKIDSKFYLYFYKIKLLGEKKSVKEIAFSLGYEDASSFIAVFKKHYGKTPANYLAK